MITRLLNATWVSPDGTIQNGEIIIKDRKFFSFSSSARATKANQTYDLKGYLIVPGMIDTHVHFREPGDLKKEGIGNGSLAALRGGITTVLDMPNNRPPCSTANRFSQKRNRFQKKCLVNWGLHFQASDKSQLPPKVVSGKVYMAKSSPAKAITTVAQLAGIFAKFPVVSIHAEDETLFLTAEKYHHLNRPKESLTSALSKIERAFNLLPDNGKPRLVLCHISTQEEVEWLHRKKLNGWDIYGETCPHYLLFTEEDYVKKGNWYKVNPPLRGKADRTAIWNGLTNRTIDFIGSDHAPHLPAQKLDHGNPPSGIAGIEWQGPVLYSLVDRKRLTWKQWLELTVLNAADCFSIPLRDGIKPGCYADLVVLSPPGNFRSSTQIVSHTCFNPYSELTFSREIRAVMINGSWAWAQDRFIPRFQLDFQPMEVY